MDAAFFINLKNYTDYKFLESFVQKYFFGFLTTTFLKWKSGKLSIFARN